MEIAEIIKILLFLVLDFISCSLVKGLFLYIYIIPQNRQKVKKYRHLCDFLHSIMRHIIQWFLLCIIHNILCFNKHDYNKVMAHTFGPQADPNCAKCLLPFCKLFRQFFIAKSLAKVCYHIQ